MFLDDIRLPGHVTWLELPDKPYMVVRNYDEFVQVIINHGVPEFISFDHDLADEHYQTMLKDMQVNSEMHLTFILKESITDIDYGPEKTGYECAKWLVEHCADNGYKFPLYTVHSMNPVGSERIKYYIENAKKHLDI